MRISDTTGRRMARGRCVVCGHDDVALTKSGKVHPLHERFSQQHQNAVALRRDMKAVQDEARETNR